MLAHDLVNNLAVIVGRCDLLSDGKLPESITKHVQEIRHTAESMALKLNQHQCHLASLARSATMQRKTLIG
jgi:hypothetical protein